MGVLWAQVRSAHRAPSDRERDTLFMRAVLRCHNPCASVQASRGEPVCSRWRADIDGLSLLLNIQRAK